MTHKYNTSLFIFRRDLRIEDNTALLYALEESEQVIPCFIFTPEQVGNNNLYRSYAAIQFMVESLKELRESLKANKGHLYFFYGTAEQIVEKLITSQTIDAVFFNKDYTPYSRKRDSSIQALCESRGISCNISPDALLIEPEDGLTEKGTPYYVFTPFFKKNSQKLVIKPYYGRRNNYATHAIAGEKDLSFLDSLFPKSIALPTRGGRTTGKKILAGLAVFKSYNEIRNNMAQETTSLSAHNKFGTVSIREVATAIIDKIGITNGLFQQLYWRDFFYHVAWHYPHVFGKSFQEKYETIEWSTSKKNFERWCEGMTGFPLVDAGMRQINQTGYMHNRARLVVGSFLTKDLHISWRWGEKYFAQHLEDYDPCVNNGSWQWVASTGCDSQPYFRIFNPWLQQKRFDPQCIYIKKWLPELRDLSVDHIHNWERQTSSYKGYPVPMINHKEESTRTKEIYKKAASAQHE